jgi:predicted permease
VDAVGTVALPVFALVFTGVVARRWRRLDTASVAGLNGFVYWLALPALLFVRVADIPLGRLVDWRLLAIYHAAGLAVFAAAALLARTAFGRGGAVPGLAGLTAAFGNVGYMGLPIAFTAFGDAATPAVVLLVVSEIALTVSLGVAMAEVGRGGGGWRPAVRTVGEGLATNPMVVATLAGAILAMTGLALPAPIAAFGALLGGAALPCALVALGGSLVGPLRAVGRPDVLVLVALKLVAHPLAVGLLVSQVGGLDTVAARVAIVVAALPTAVTVFVLAQRYGAYVEETSSAVVLSTALSVVTVSLVLAATGP